MAQSDREVLFANDSFVIGVLQAVSGGSLVAALSQSEGLIKHAGRFTFVGFLTVTAIALPAAVLAAYWKHRYKMWDVKAGVSVTQGQSAVGSCALGIIEQILGVDAEGYVCGGYCYRPGGLWLGDSAVGSIFPWRISCLTPQSRADALKRVADFRVRHLLDRAIGRALRDAYPLANRHRYKKQDP